MPFLVSRTFAPFGQPGPLTDHPVSSRRGRHRGRFAQFRPIGETPGVAPTEPAAKIRFTSAESMRQAV